VQAVTRTPDPADPHRRPEDIRHALHQAITLISAALPSIPYNDPTSWPRWRTLVPHIAALVAHAPADTQPSPSPSTNAPSPMQSGCWGMAIRSLRR